MKEHILQLEDTRKKSMSMIKTSSQLNDLR